MFHLECSHLQKDDLAWKLDCTLYSKVNIFHFLNQQPSTGTLRSQDQKAALFTKAMIECTACGTKQQHETHGTTDFFLLSSHTGNSKEWWWGNTPSQWSQWLPTWPPHSHIHIYLGLMEMFLFVVVIFYVGISPVLLSFIKKSYNIKVPTYFSIFIYLWREISAYFSISHFLSVFLEIFKNDYFSKD